MLGPWCYDVIALFLLAHMTCRSRIGNSLNQDTLSFVFFLLPPYQSHTRGH